MPYIHVTTRPLIFSLQLYVLTLYYNPDCSVPGPDCSVPGPDCSVPGPNCSVPGPNCSVPGPDCSVPAQPPLLKSDVSCRNVNGWQVTADTTFRNLNYLLLKRLEFENEGRNNTHKLKVKSPSVDTGLPAERVETLGS